MAPYLGLSGMVWLFLSWRWHPDLFQKGVQGKHGDFSCPWRADHAPTPLLFTHWISRAGSSMTLSSLCWWKGFPWELWNAGFCSVLVLFWILGGCFQVFPGCTSQVMWGVHQSLLYFLLLNTCPGQENVDFQTIPKLSLCKKNILSYLVV